MRGVISDKNEKNIVKESRNKDEEEIIRAMQKECNILVDRQMTQTYMY